MWYRYYKFQSAFNKLIQQDCERKQLHIKNIILITVLQNDIKHLSIGRRSPEEREAVPKIGIIKNFGDQLPRMPALALLNDCSVDRSHRS